MVVLKWVMVFVEIPSPSAVGAAGHGGDGGGGNEGGDGVDVKLSSGGKAEPHTPPPSPVDKRTATLQRGLKGIRKSFRKIKNKSKNQDNLKDLEEVKPPVVFIHPVPQTSTPVKNATSEEDLKIKSSSASPFLKFRSLRVKKSDATTLLRISKIRASVGKKTTLHRTDPTASPVVVSKEELIISSEPPLKSYRLNTTIQTVGSVEDESFDSTNPFSDTDEINDEKNPFSRSYLSASSVESCDPQRRPKSLRRSIRKTLSKMSGIKSKKKKTADVAPESPNVAGQTAVSRQLFLDPTDGGAKDSSSVILEEVQEETVPSAEPPTAVNEDNFEELKCRLINLKDISTRAPYSERLELLPQLHVLLSLRL
ncbi:uncharacterized protein LOC108667616, partial [Hyalella azteca]|uniref:Uncharacterized protein LOC108667616 n=1 Tax=Hyalella azteca TaxID=294128 RepID=A0A8B7N9M8_HYAAZ